MNIIKERENELKRMLELYVQGDVNVIQQGIYIDVY